HDALSGRHPEHGVRARLGQGADPRREARVAQGRAAVGLPADPAGRQDVKANQVLHGEAANLMAKVRSNSHYRPSVADPASPDTFVHKIKVPTFAACQWTDEQTGGHCADLASRFTGTRKKWFTFTNGTHIDSLDPETANRW